MSRRLAFLLLCAVAAFAAGSGVAHAGPSSSTTAIVSMGDSYISGEGGRWQGNSNTWIASRNGTDRAYRSTWWGWTYDTNAVYPGSYSNGCHRSDVAQIRSASISVNQKLNIACSGARTEHVLRSSTGGQSFKGEAPQADQLATIAQQRNVKLVVLSIGGNDLGFADIIIDCGLRWASSSSSNPNLCRYDQQANVNQRMPAAMAGVRKAIDEIRAVMGAAGYGSSQYRIVLQSYPSPIPRAAENRYPESGWSRLDTGGCPFWNADSDWARDSLTPQIAANLKAVAAQKGVQFLDLQDSHQGREVCSKTTSLVGSGGPSPAQSEWMRFLVSGYVQGDAQESFHPNAYGQQALGRCLTLIYQTTANRSCRNTPGQSHSGMYLTTVP